MSEEKSSSTRSERKEEKSSNTRPEQKQSTALFAAQDNVQKQSPTLLAAQHNAQKQSLLYWQCNTPLQHTVLCADST